MRRIAREYSPACAIPYVSRVDAGTSELGRRSGVDVVSSGDVIQRFSTVWDAAAIATHREASEKLYRIKDRAFALVAQRIGDGAAVTEYDVQQRMADWFREEGLLADSDPIVAATENAGNPHYLPTAAVHRAFHRDDLVLLDLWGKLDRPGAVYADITWAGYIGNRVPPPFTRALPPISPPPDPPLAPLPAP